MGYWKFSHIKIAAVFYYSENKPIVFTCFRVRVFISDLAIQHHSFKPYHYPVCLFIE